MKIKHEDIGFADYRENLYFLEYAPKRALLPKLSKLKDQSRSVACLMPKYKFCQSKRDGFWKLGDWAKKSLSEHLQRIFKKDQPEKDVKTTTLRFDDEPAIGASTGFLVGINGDTSDSKYLVTAAHCLSKKKKLDFKKIKDLRVVFDFFMHDSSTYNHNFEKIYKIKKVIDFKYDKKNDWALVKLSKKVKNRLPLQIGNNESSKPGDPVYMLGHPEGLPLKVTHSGEITKNSSHYFRATLPAFGGSSGSPVFNIFGEVLGICIRGFTKYIVDSKSDQVVPNFFKNADNSISRAQIIKPIRKLLSSKSNLKKSKMQIR